jgi:RNA polymerase sigma factor (sigma-70 family)
MHDARKPSRSITKYSDRETVQKVLHGDLRMFELIVHRYNLQLFRVGMAYLRNRAQVEDAMQTAYVKAFRNLRRFQERANFSTWLTRIMINECLMMRRHATKPGQNTVELGPLASKIPAGHSPDQVASLKERKALLEEAITELPQRYRAVYLLREVQQLSIAQTAVCLSMSPASVKVNLHRARERLKARLLGSARGLELFPYSASYCNRMVDRVRASLAVVSRSLIPRASGEA